VITAGQSCRRDRRATTDASRFRKRGLDYLNNRHYDPTTGVFVSVDPLVTKTMQPYIYGAANPVTYSDPEGLCPVADAEACRIWAGGEASTDVQFWTESIPQVKSGEIPTYRPPRVSDSYQGDDGGGWTASEATALNYYHCRHFSCGGLFREDSGQTKDLWWAYRTGEDNNNMWGHVFSESSFSGPTRLASFAAVALTAGSASMATNPVPFAERAFLNRLVGGNSRLFGDSRVAGRSGWLNQAQTRFKAGWSKNVQDGVREFRVGVGRNPANLSQARWHPLRVAQIRFQQADVLVDTIRRLFGG